MLLSKRYFLHVLGRNSLNRNQMGFLTYFENYKLVRIVQRLIRYYSSHLYEHVSLAAQALERSRTLVNFGGIGIFCCWQCLFSWLDMAAYVREER